MALLRFHWDFFGPDAVPTCAHFEVHLKEFCQREGIAPVSTWTGAEGPRSTATLECGEEHLVLVRDRLRPKRAERVLPDA